MTFRFPAKNHHPQQQHQQGAAMEGRPAAAPARVSVFRRLLVRVTPAERVLAADGKERDGKGAGDPGGGGEAEVGSAALDRMVLSFMEDAAAAVERPPRGRCNCFNGNQDASDDEDFGFLPSSAAAAANAAPAPAGDALELLKGLVQCASTAERNLLADASRIAERCGGGGGKGGLGGVRKKKADVRRAVAEGLRALGYDAAVCTSRWDKSASHPAGEHEYVDVSLPAPAGGRLVVEVDFRSEFEVARPTKAYRAALQALPPLFVGAPDRAGRVAAVVAEAARQSLRKRGLHFPPWRKPEYMRAKWTAPHARAPSPPPPAPVAAAAAATFSGAFELRFDDKGSPNAAGAGPGGEDGEEKEDDKKITVVVSPSPPPSLPWRPTEQPEAGEQQPQAAKAKVVTGLASVL